MLTIDSATSAGGSHPGELRVVVTFPLPAEHLTALRGQGCRPIPATHRRGDPLPEGLVGPGEVVVH